jgi:hypothetical protein
VPTIGVSRLPAVAGLLLALLAGALSFGCGTSGAPAPGAPASPPDASATVALYRSRCGACHRPVAPGSEPRDKLHEALLQHRKRTHLTEQQWGAIEAFLAPPAPAQPGAAD